MPDYLSILGAVVLCWSCYSWENPSKSQLWYQSILETEEWQVSLEEHRGNSSGSWCPASSGRPFGAAVELSHPAVPGLPLRRQQRVWSEGSSRSSDPPLVLLASPTAFTLLWLCQSQRLPKIKGLGQSMTRGAEQHTMPMVDVPWWVKIAAAPGAVWGRTVLGTWAAFPQTFPLHRCARWAGVEARKQGLASVEKPCLRRELLARLKFTGWMWST